jgi:hypothetical protein
MFTAMQMALSLTAFIVRRLAFWGDPTPPGRA